MKHGGFSCFTCRLFKQDQWGTWRCLDDDWEKLCRGKFEEWLEREAGRRVMSDEEAILKIFRAIKLLRESNAHWGQVILQVSGNEIKFVNVVLPVPSESEEE